MRLEGKVALITGAIGGMGGASARLFAKEGAAVLVAARHDELADPIVKEITDAGGRAAFIQLEVTGQEQWEAAVKQAEKQFGELHILRTSSGATIWSCSRRSTWTRGTRSSRSTSPQPWSGCRRARR